MSEIVINIEELTHRFGKNVVLNGFSLQVEAGKTFAFLGLNAAGKTTTIRLLLGLLEVAILDQGHIVKQAAPERLRDQVKQIIFKKEVFVTLPQSIEAIGTRHSGTEVAVTVDNASEVLNMLEVKGLEHRVVDLNLDEIFEAYVSGIRNVPGETTSTPAVLASHP